jgi:predicted AlkP superfamily phosphohydrolase/phosphomutase
VTKVLILGIDALDCELIREFAADLPNISRLREQAVQLKVRSTFPPDSDTAWATIMTGLNPAQHGIVRFIDPLEKTYQIHNQAIDNEILHGKTFWEVAAKSGIKTIAIFPHLCYPLWEAPGTVVVRGTSVADVQARPAEITSEYPDSDLLLGVRGFPERGNRGLSDYAGKLSLMAESDAQFALNILKNNDWDLFFMYWSTIDAIGHFFWSYFDPTDPGFVEGNPLQRVIPDTYKLYDDIIGRFINQVGNEVTLIVLSDHGHGTRPYNLVNINEILHQAGYLNTNDLKRNPHLKIYEQAKRYGSSIISRFGLGKQAARILRRFPGFVQRYTRPASINWERTLAYASDMSGIKSYSYGGIILNRAALNGRNYETVRDEIVDLIKQKTILPDGAALLDFIARREDVYTGPFIENYPDILLEFKYGYGVGWAVDVPLLTQAYAHNVVPGSHRGSTGTFFIRSPLKIKKNTIDLIDIAPTLLDIFGLDVTRGYEGKSIINAKNDPVIDISS